MGYFAPQRKLGTVQDILEFKKQVVVLADPDDSLQSIISQMATLGISQMPMTIGKGDLRMIEELDILRAVAGGEHSLEDVARDIARPLEGQVEPSQTLDQIQQIFEENNVAIVVEDGQVVGVVNKIDLLEYYAQKNREAA
jgi:predicted transcriptional regulator